MADWGRKAAPVYWGTLIIIFVSWKWSDRPMRRLLHDALSCSGLYIELHLIRGSTTTLFPCRPFFSIAQGTTNGQTVYICIWHSAGTTDYFYSNTVTVLLIVSQAKTETRMLRLLIIYLQFACSLMGTVGILWLLHVCKESFRFNQRDIDHVISVCTRCLSV